MIKLHSVHPTYIYYGTCTNNHNTNTCTNIAIQCIYARKIDRREGGWVTRTRDIVIYDPCEKENHVHVYKIKLLLCKSYKF